MNTIGRTQEIRKIEEKLEEFGWFWFYRLSLTSPLNPPVGDLRDKQNQQSQRLGLLYSPEIAGNKVKAAVLIASIFNAII
jgi:hypothetical protein